MPMRSPFIKSEMERRRINSFEKKSPYVSKERSVSKHISVPNRFGLKSGISQATKLLDELRHTKKSGINVKKNIAGFREELKKTFNG